MKIYLIRHGKTEANERHLYCGSTDLPLSQCGKEELGKLRYDLPNARFVSSGMRRANETLRILFGDIPFRIEPRFREVDFGIFEMRGYEELKNTAPYQVWLTGDNERNIPPKGESGEQMTRRVLEAFGELRKDTVIVTHGGVIAAIMNECFPNAGNNRYTWQPPCGGGWLIEGNTYASLAHGFQKEGIAAEGEV